MLEGWRVSETATAHDFDPRAVTTPVYRSANVGRLRLLLGAQHWASPTIEGRWCVRPGDVVVNKLAPVRSAFVSSAAKRHPVDGNTLIVRGLPRPAAVWLCQCLNSGYEQLLLLGSGPIPRVNLGALAALRIPPVPPALDILSARLGEALDEQSLTAEALQRVRDEARAQTSAPTQRTASLNGDLFFSPDAVTHDNWLPTATALRAEQIALDDEGWVAIDELASFDDRARLGEAPEGARALRLRDVGEDLFVAPSDEAHPSDARRALARPLQPGEVLLSTLGSSFRAAYVDDDVPKHTYASDGWVRLRFRETPAAWALLLSTEVLRSQAERLTVGSVQQFVPPESLRALRVPMPPRELRERWQRSVERHHAQRRAQDRQWVTLTRALSAELDAVHRPFVKGAWRAKESAQ